MKFLTLIFCFLSLFFFREEHKITVYMVGDSTMAYKPNPENPERGWGMMLQQFFDSIVCVENHAVNGRSTRSFISEGRWEVVCNNIKKGDYVIIQFGHNDASIEKKDRYTPPADYKRNLIRFVNDVFEKKGTPILCTSIVRRKFDDQGNLVDTHGVYPSIVRQIADSLHVFLIDMQQASEKVVAQAGVEESKKIYLWIKPGDYPMLPDGRTDNTHFSALGANLMAKLAVERLKQLPDLAKHLTGQWIPDNGDGTYKNPVIYADYSDPDVIRVDSVFYMTSSSFNCVPALPVLQSVDLVNWRIIGHVFTHQPPENVFNTPQHGKGVWAPSIRYVNHEFYIYYGDPDFGIYMCKAKNAAGPWTEPLLVHAAKGWIDPCPFWDENGEAWLIHGWAGSRAGVKSILTLHRMSPDGTKIQDDGLLVFDGHLNHPTVEGPKLYKRNGYYYIMAPAGGVKTGWQLVLRSKTIVGPYEEKIVLHQGSTSINGPHQGGWVETLSGESWFLHFQDLDAFGRVVHLQPVMWKNDWPQVGITQNKDSIGEPVSTYRKPNVKAKAIISAPICSDEFDQPSLGLQWQWQANSCSNWGFPTNRGYLRLNALPVSDSLRNFWNMPSLLLQKFMAPQFTATVKLHFVPHFAGDKTGLIIMGSDYAYLSVIFKNGKKILSCTVCKNADKGLPEIVQDIKPIESTDVYLRVAVSEKAVCVFSFSEDGVNFTDAGKPFLAKPGKWIGAKTGLFCAGTEKSNDAGYVDVDWFRIE